MLVILNKTETNLQFSIGDELKITYNDGLNDHILIDKRSFDTYGKIDLVYIFIFTDEDGYAYGSNFGCIFCSLDNIPKEILEAVHVNDLPTNKRFNLACTSSLKLK